MIAGRVKRPTTCRNVGNAVAGWFIAYGLLALVVASDPFGLYSVWEDGAEGFDSFTVGVVGISMVGGLLAFAVFARPHVEMTREALVIRNILRDVHIPWGALQDVDTERRLHLRVKADAQWYRAWGTETSNAAVVAGSPGPAGRAGALIDARRPARPPTPSQVVVRRRRLAIGEVVLLAAWGAYILAAVVHRGACWNC